MSDSAASKPGYQALEQAADFYAQLLEADPQGEVLVRLRSWLDECEEHHLAWHYVEAVSQRFQPLRGGLASVAADTLLQPSVVMARRYVLKMAALFASGTLLSWLTYRYTPLQGALLAINADYHNATGEIKKLTLQDGSRIWLNIASAVDVQYDQKRRHIHLLSGEILIETARDQRPFFVSSAQGQLQALGTRFNVEQKEGSTHLTVYRGAVAVRAVRAQTSRRVNEGQQLDFDLHGQGKLFASEYSDAGWVQGVLQVNDVPLGEVIAQLARYRKGYLACDPEVADLRVTGTFPLTDTDKSLMMLSQIFPVRIHHRFSWWVSVEPRGE